MIVRKLKKVFGAPARRNDGSPVWFQWIADPFRKEATLINSYSGRMLAYVRHDGYGKYERTVVVSPWLARKLIRENGGYPVSLASFPRVTLELLWLKVNSLNQAMRTIDAIFRINRR